MKFFGELSLLNLLLILQKKRKFAVAKTDARPLICSFECDKLCKTRKQNLKKNLRRGKFNVLKISNGRKF